MSLTPSTVAKANVARRASKTHAGPQPFRAAGDAAVRKAGRRAQISIRPSVNCGRPKPSSTRAKAQLKAAHDQVDFTELKADAEGVVTAVGAEPGEVVQAGSDDRQARPPGRTRRRFRCSRPGAAHGPARPRRRCPSRRRPVRDGNRPRARGFASGRSRHAYLPGQGRPHRSARRYAARGDGDRHAADRRSADDRDPLFGLDRVQRPSCRVDRRSQKP